MRITKPKAAVISMIMVFLLSGCGEADSGNPKIEVSEALGLMAEKEENGHFEA